MGWKKRDEQEQRARGREWKKNLKCYIVLCCSICRELHNQVEAAHTGDEPQEPMWEAVWKRTWGDGRVALNKRPQSERSVLHLSTVERISQGNALYQTCLKNKIIYEGIPLAMSYIRSTRAIPYTFTRELSHVGSLTAISYIGSSWAIWFIGSTEVISHVRSPKAISFIGSIGTVSCAWSQWQYPTPGR